ncbi:dTDP-4-dehydrorhamnose 3,5-epimerase family protein [Aquirufa sp. TARAVU-A1A]
MQRKLKRKGLNGQLMNKEIVISGLEKVPLKQIIDERGAVFHYLKSSDSTFKGFGEAYYSKVNPGIIKGWKKHNNIHQHFCVPVGAVKIVIYDNRENSPTNGHFNEIVLDELNNYVRLSIPPGLWYSFKCISESFALLANIIDTPHDPNESEVLPLETNKINYLWK